MSSGSQRERGCHHTGQSSQASLDGEINKLYFNERIYKVICVFRVSDDQRCDIINKNIVTGPDDIELSLFSEAETQTEISLSSLCD